MAASWGEASLYSPREAAHPCTSCLRSHPRGRRRLHPSQGAPTDASGRNSALSGIVGSCHPLGFCPRAPQLRGQVVGQRARSISGGRRKRGWTSRQGPVASASVCRRENASGLCYGLCQAAVHGRPRLPVVGAMRSDFAAVGRHRIALARACRFGSDVCSEFKGGACDGSQEQGPQPRQKMASLGEHSLDAPHTYGTAFGEHALGGHHLRPDNA